MPKENKPQRNKWDLIIGIFLIFMGAYRLYNFYLNDLEYSTFRIVLTYGFVVLGFYNLYKYFKAEQN